MILLVRLGVKFVVLDILHHIHVDFVSDDAGIVVFLSDLVELFVLDFVYLFLLLLRSFAA
jgi:hypothetical protein